jgi:hypothetical protein
LVLLAPNQDGPFNSVGSGDHFQSGESISAGAGLACPSAGVVGFVGVVGPSARAVGGWLGLATKPSGESAQVAATRPSLVMCFTVAPTCLPRQSS